MPPHGLKVPIILGGSKREDLARLLAPADMRMEIGVAAIGVASAVKMCRSIMIKGLEALTVECLFTARRYGVEDQVLASLVETYPGMDWKKEADYLVSRVVQHGRRRAAEMREVARTVEEVGLQALLARAHGPASGLDGRLGERGRGIEVGKKLAQGCRRNQDQRLERALAGNCKSLVPVQSASTV